MYVDDILLFKCNICGLTSKINNLRMLKTRCEQYGNLAFALIYLYILQLLSAHRQTHA